MFLRFLVVVYPRTKSQLFSLSKRAYYYGYFIMNKYRRVSRVLDCNKNTTGISEYEGNVENKSRMA